MVVCLHLPRFELAVAAGGAQALAGRPLALAPAPGERRVGGVSGAAEAHGVTEGMRLGEALARCPSLGLVPPDPLGVAEAWEQVLAGLEKIGAAVETPVAGTAFFAAGGLLRLHGGLGGVIQATRRSGGRVRPARVGAGPSRFCAMAAAFSARPRRGPVIVEARQATRWLSRQPVSLLAYRKQTGQTGQTEQTEQTAELVAPLARLGIHTLGELRSLGRDALADRFGTNGLLAYDLASGLDTPLRPRAIPERLEEAMGLPQADSGPALERVLGVLIERLLAHPQRRGRSLRAVTLSAQLVEGGTWSQTVAFRQAIADGQRIRLALCQRLTQLPAPAESLKLAAQSFGPPSAEQQDLLGGGAQERRAPLRDAIDQARAAAGPDAALRVLLVEPDSRMPERRCVLAPFQG
jgi:protein ImuB